MRTLRGRVVFVASLTLAISCGIQLQAQTFKVLYSFTGGSDGANPARSLTVGPGGDLYGTTQNGGDLSCQPPYGCGTVFKVNTVGKQSLLYTFNETDGADSTVNLIHGPGDNLYGTTPWGGSGSCSDPFGYSGCGTVFKLDKTSKLTVLYNFTGKADGANPGGLVVDPAGNLYGSAGAGGTYNAGTVFELNASGSLTVLHNFRGPDGVGPSVGLLRNGAGLLYGVTTQGGNLSCAYGCGVVFAIRP